MIHHPMMIVQVPDIKSRNLIDTTLSMFFSSQGLSLDVLLWIYYMKILTEVETPKQPI